MYNFDPAAVEQFLIEMRTLATNGHNAAYGMRAKIGLKGLINGIAVSPRTECAPATLTSSKNPERDNVLGVDGDGDVDGDGEGGPAVEERSRRAQSRQASNVIKNKNVKEQGIFSAVYLLYWRPCCANIHKLPTPLPNKTYFFLIY